MHGPTLENALVNALHTLPDRALGLATAVGDGLKQALPAAAQLLAQRPGKPLACLADQLQPLRVSLGKGLIGHCSLPWTVLDDAHSY